MKNDKKPRRYKIINISLIALIVITWIVVYGITGLPGAYAWFALKLVFPFLGLAGILLNLTLLIILFFNKKKINNTLIGLLVCTILTLHLVLTMNIAQLPYPSRIQQVQPSVTVNWPLAEQTVVGWGGDSIHSNLPHAIWPSERWAYDLVMEPYNTGSTNLEDYGIWSKEVLSPTSGTIIAAYDNEPDIVPGTEDIHSMEGNHVYLQLEETGTYLLLNHLKQDSVTVKVGDHVNTGDVLGRVGNSGSTSEPHLHIHHQRQNPIKALHPILAEGLPLYFKSTDTDPMPVKGTVVNITAPPD
ncbi:M23 family metallopeptidase [Paenibacillus segetis]|uniref:Peptidase M24 n=1 Tax=Paenibacillus segetis TaxID=1325360 RepID=A0ABQ1YEW1_9BACL|nr:M23 family metallopeptidase [Paenibacillus segetis]GGH23573.1 peptidase M24 [Paenibacillus segetis]